MEDIIITQSGEKLKMVGQMALRGPDGKPLPSQPIYAFVEKREIDSNGMTRAERDSLDDIADILGRKFKAYVDGCKKAGVPI